MSESQPGKGSCYGSDFDRLADRWRALEYEHDQVHPDRNDCGGVGGCSMMRAAHDLKTQMGEQLATWRLHAKAAPELTPEQELRAAATSLREAVKNVQQYDDGIPVDWFDAETLAQNTISDVNGRHRYSITDGDAVWIALMRPDLAEPFAALLEAEAGRWDAVRIAGATRPGNDALVVARALLGGEPS
jgi:hypothetical protein